MGVASTILYLTAHTPDAFYTMEASRWKSHMEAMAVPHKVVPYEPGPTWMASCAKKARIIHDAVAECVRPKGPRAVVWLDLEARMTENGIRRMAAWVRTRPPSLSVVRRGRHIRGGMYAITGTNQPDNFVGVLSSLRSWAEACEENPEAGEDTTLRRMEREGRIVLGSLPPAAVFLEGMDPPALRPRGVWCVQDRMSHRPGNPHRKAEKRG